MLKINIFNQYTAPTLPEFIDRNILRFQDRWRVAMTVHAVSGRWYDAEDHFLFRRWEAHHDAFCREKRSERRLFNKLCLDNCGAEVESESVRSGFPFRHFCWKGASELVVPFVWNGALELIFFVGPFRGEPPEDPVFQENWERLPAYPESTQGELIEECLTLGMAFYLRLHQSDLHEARPVNRKEAIREYILRYGCGNITLNGLARHLGVSASRASHLCLTLVGLSFQQLVLNVRMKKAGQMLAGSGEPIKSVAEKSGFSNVYYFTRMFHQFYGETPARYRRNAQNEEI